MELFTLTPKKRQLWETILAVLFLGMAIVSLGFSITQYASGYSGMVMLIVAILFVTLWFLFQFRRNYEFELAYFDGDFKVVRIANKSRRKLKLRFTMDDVVQIAPVGDRSVYKYEEDRIAKHLDFSSHADEAKPYIIVIRSGENVTVITVEPDERMLDEFCKKYRSKVVR